MQKSIAYVGLDVHKDSIAVAIARPGEPVADHGQIANRPDAVRRQVRLLQRQGSGQHGVAGHGP